jgi:hypothetical protein
VWGKRWTWIRDCPDWEAFEAWRAARGSAELEAGLGMLLDYGPEYDCPRIGEDIYVVYACYRRTVFWLIVGVGRPGIRQLLPLKWGVNPTEARIARAGKEASEKLQKWRTSHGN